MQPSDDMRTMENSELEKLLNSRLIHMQHSKPTEGQFVSLLAVIVQLTQRGYGFSTSGDLLPPEASHAND